MAATQTSHEPAHRYGGTLLAHDGVLLGYLTWGAAQALGPEIDAGVAVSATFVEAQEEDGVALAVRLEEQS